MKDSTFEAAAKLLTDRFLLTEAEGLPKCEKKTEPKKNKMEKDEEETSEGSSEVREKKHFKALKKIVLKLIDWTEKDESREGAKKPLEKALEIIDEEIGDHEEEE